MVISSSHVGLTLLRSALGLVLVFHSLYLKLLVFTLPGTAQFFASLGLPAFSAYLVFGIEAVAGVALLLGYQTRLAAWAVVPILLGATWAHSDNGWLFTNPGGGWEYPVFLAAIALALGCLTPSATTAARTDALATERGSAS